MTGQRGENQFGKVSQITFRALYRDGRTILDDVFFTAPYKIMKPFAKKNGGIQVMPLCASAGLMKGLNTKNFIQKFRFIVEEN